MCWRDSGGVSLHKSVISPHTMSQMFALPSSLRCESSQICQDVSCTAKYVLVLWSGLSRGSFYPQTCCSPTTRSVVKSLVLLDLRGIECWVHLPCSQIIAEASVTQQTSVPLVLYFPACRGTNGALPRGGPLCVPHCCQFHHCLHRPAAPRMLWGRREADDLLSSIQRSDTLVYTLNL